MKNSAILAALRPDFDQFAAPAVIVHIYRLIRVMAALQTSLFIAVLIAIHSWIGPVLLFFGLACAPLAWLLGCLIARVVLEFFAVAFAIHSEVRKLTHQPRGGHHPPHDLLPPPPWA